MKRASVRELHLNTSSLLKQVEQGEVFMIEKNGRVIAEVRGRTDGICPPFPNREALFASLTPVDEDFTTGIISEDRERG
jgi:antitoxin (DNA-binding transcriptional repressor) of toxin-antitoxin stability system